MSILRQNQNANAFGQQNNNANQNPAPARFGANNNANNQNNQNANNQNGTAAPRFGANNNANNQNANNQNNQNNQNANNNAFANRLNRFGRQTIHWTIAPLTNAAVRISLDGLGDPFHRLLGTPLNVEYGKPAKVVEALQNDEALLAQLTDVLNEAWESYHFSGAALLFPWDDDVRKAYSQPIFPNDQMPVFENDPNNQNNQNNANNQNPDEALDWLESLAGIRRSNVTCLRAIDLAFVLNVLARSRANVIVGNTPLALEPGFLTQTVICDDPRIVALARATGCIDEAWWYDNK